LNPSGN
jgi:hypothetical protein